MLSKIVKHFSRLKLAARKDEGSYTMFSSIIDMLSLCREAIWIPAFDSWLFALQLIFCMLTDFTDFNYLLILLIYNHMHF